MRRFVLAALAALVIVCSVVSQAWTAEWQKYVIKKGDTLSEIAYALRGEWALQTFMQKLSEWNPNIGIKLIQPGQVLKYKTLPTVRDELKAVVQELTVKMDTTKADNQNRFAEIESALDQLSGLRDLVNSLIESTGQADDRMRAGLKIQFEEISSLNAQIGNIEKKFARLASKGDMEKINSRLDQLSAANKEFLAALNSLSQFITKSGKREGELKALKEQMKLALDKRASDRAEMVKFFRAQGKKINMVLLVAVAAIVFALLSLVLIVKFRPLRSDNAAEISDISLAVQNISQKQEEIAAIIKKKAEENIKNNKPQPFLLDGRDFVYLHRRDAAGKYLCPDNPETGKPFGAYDKLSLARKSTISTLRKHSAREDIVAAERAAGRLLTIEEYI